MEGDLDVLLDQIVEKSIEQSNEGDKIGITFLIRWVAGEVFMNLVKHGPETNATQATVTFNVNHELALEVMQNGDGFNPNDIPDCTDDEHLERPTGRGIQTALQLIANRQQGDSLEFIDFSGGYCHGIRVRIRLVVAKEKNVPQEAVQPA